MKVKKHRVFFAIYNIFISKLMGLKAYIISELVHTYIINKLKN